MEELNRKKLKRRNSDNGDGDGGSQPELTYAKSLKVTAEKNDAERKGSKQRQAISDSELLAKLRDIEFERFSGSAYDPNYDPSCDFDY